MNYLIQINCFLRKILNFLSDFKESIDGKCDDILEIYFYNTGVLDEVKERLNKVKK